MSTIRIVEMLAILMGTGIVCTIAIGGIVDTINAPPVKDVATAYAETLLPGKEYRVVCSEKRAPSLCAIVHENNGSVTVIPIRCGHSMDSCTVRGSQ